MKSILLGTILLCAAAVPLTGSDAASPTVDEVSVALHAGDASGALALATQALAGTSLAPYDRARLLIERGLAHDTLGERDDALVDFTEALNSHALTSPEVALGLYYRGAVLDELSRTEDAIGDYSAAIRIEPDLSGALNNRGNVYRRSGRLAEARRDYEASIAAGNPHREYPDFGLGQIAEASGDAEAARAYYQAALIADPAFDPAKERLAALGAAADGSDAPIVLRRPAEGVIHLKPPGRHREPAIPAPATEVPVLRSALNDGAVNGAAVVQLGAWRSQGEAAIAWSRIARVATTELVGLTPQVISVDLPGKGRYYRLRTNPAKGALALCAVLRAKGLACIVVRD
ncbi:MAG: tetratricopeptide repeat protein [Rhizomicrobium sp.]